jgi:hypothetical protein
MPTTPPPSAGSSGTTGAATNAVATSPPSPAVATQRYRDRLAAVLSDDTATENTKDAAENVRSAGESVQQSIDQFANAAEAFESGDTMGGTAMVMRGFGSLSGTLALVAPPVGALVGALLGAITSIIAAILEAMRPKTESLEQKLEKMIRKGALRQAYVAMSAGKASWELAETKIFMLAEQRQKAADLLQANSNLSAEERKELEDICAGRTWEYLTQNIGWERHKALISESFATLAQERGTVSSEWLALFDITVSYAVRFWMAFESMAGLVGDPGHNKTLAAYNNMQLFQSLRRVVARQLAEDIASVYFEGQNTAKIYHLCAGIEKYQEIGYRVGVTGQSVEATQWLGGKSSTFAVSPGGTIFSTGHTSNEEPVYVGRGNAPWSKAPKARYCDQVFIGESNESDTVIVACLHGYGQKVTFTPYHDEEGRNEKSRRDWTPNDERWGTEVEFDFTSHNLTILHVAIRPNRASYSAQVLGYRKDPQDVQLYEVYRDGKKIELAHNGPYFNPEQVKKELGSDLWRRSKSTHCSISYYLGEPVVQLGALVQFWEGGKAHIWDLRESQFLNAPDIKVYQARFFPDLTFVCATDKGLFMRCRVDPRAKDKDPIWVVDRALQTDWFDKHGSKELASAYWLFDHLSAASKKQRGAFVGG